MINWNYIGITFGFMIIGYLLGSILSSIWITKLLKIEDVRKVGSKNAGATNVLRIHGKLIGLIVFILDISKTIFVMVLAKLFFNYQEINIQAVGLAVVIGHIFPIFSKFKGGKGAATMLGFTIAINWTLFFVGLIIFMIIVIPTKKVSLGSLITPIILVLTYFGLSFIPGYRSVIFEPIVHAYSIWINITAWIIVILFVIFAHRDNIKRLINKKENTYNKTL